MQPDSVVMEFLAFFVNGIVLQLVFLLALMLGDFLFGILVAVKKKHFDWEYITNFLISDGAWILVWMFVSFLSAMIEFFGQEAVIPGYDIIGTLFSWVTIGAVAAKIGASLLSHFAALGVGANVLEKAAIKPSQVKDHPPAVIESGMRAYDVAKDEPAG